MITLCFVLLFLTFDQVFSAWDCSNPPKDVVKDTGECCLAPQVVPDSIESECSKKFASETEDLMRQCLVSTCVMDQLNITTNGNFITQAAMDLIKATVTNDPIWEEAMEQIAKGCMEYAAVNQDRGVGIFEAAKIPIDLTNYTVCNLMYLLFVACMDADLLTKCPDHSFMQIERCKDWKSYATDCGKDKLYLTV